MTIGSSSFGTFRPTNFNNQGLANTNPYFGTFKIAKKGRKESLPPQARPIDMSKQPPAHEKPISKVPYKQIADAAYKRNNPPPPYGNNGAGSSQFHS